MPKEVFELTHGDQPPVDQEFSRPLGKRGDAPTIWEQLQFHVSSLLLGKHRRLPFLMDDQEAWDLFFAATVPNPLAICADMDFSSLLKDVRPWEQTKKPREAYSEADLVEMFGGLVSPRTIRDRLKSSIGFKLGRHWFLAKTKLALFMDGTCSNFQGGTAPSSSTRGAPTLGSRLTEALTLVTKRKPKSSLPRSKKTSSTGKVVALPVRPLPKRR